jgi:CRISPR-associated protein Csx3
MVQMKFNIKHLSETAAVISFEYEQSITPADLKIISPPTPVQNSISGKGVILSGRGPVWLYCFLTHFYHPTKFVATYDPRLHGAVVVESHSSEYKPGDIIPISNSQIPA